MTFNSDSELVHHLAAEFRDNVSGTVSPPSSAFIFSKV